MNWFWVSYWVLWAIMLRIFIKQARRRTRELRDLIEGTPAERVSRTRGIYARIGGKQ